MRSLGSRCRDCDEVCEINGSKAVKRAEARKAEVLRTCWVAVDDFCVCVCTCEFLYEPAFMVILSHC